MGLGIKVAGDFSAKNFGNIFFEEELFYYGGVTNDAAKAAVKKFANTLRSAGLDSKFSYACVYGLNKVADSLNLIKPALGAMNGQGQFINDSDANHLGGFTPNGTTGLYHKTNAYISSPSDYVHFHFYNSTPDSQNRYLGGFFASSLEESYIAYLQRGITSGTNGVNTLVKGAIGRYDAPINILSSSQSYDTAKTGLLSMVKNLTSTRLYDNGVDIGGATTNFSWTAKGGSSFTVGMFQNSLPYSTAKFRFAAVGFVAWTASDESILSDAVNTLNVELLSLGL